MLPSGRGTPGALGFCEGSNTSDRRPAAAGGGIAAAGGGASMAGSGAAVFGSGAAWMADPCMAGRVTGGGGAGCATGPPEARS